MPSEIFVRFFRTEDKCVFEGVELEFRRDLIGECGIYCGDCRLFVLKKCEGCSNEEAKYPYYECVENKATNSRGECQEVPCEKHYGPMEVYAEEFLDWKRQEIAKA